MREGWERKDVILPPPPVPNITHVQACVANVSVWFQSKTRLRNRIFGFRRTRNKSRVEKWNGGRGRGRNETLADKPQDFETLLDSERGACLAWLVEQYWHVSMKGLFHTFLPHPLPALLFASFFVQSVTLVPRSLLRNRTETLATQAAVRESFFPLIWPCFRDVCTI